MKKLLCLLFVGLFFFSGLVNSDYKKLPENKIKAGYLYNFLLFVEWPAEAFKAPPPSPMHVCILGENPFKKMLDPILRRTAQERRIDLHYLDRNKSDKYCHILFISGSELPYLDLLIQRIQGQPILTVSDIKNFVYKGGMIGFVLKEDNVRLEINFGAIKSSGLNISSKLLELAEKVVDD